VPALENALRAPAEELPSGQSAWLAKIVDVLLWPFTRCRHSNTSRPYSDTQICFDCGSWRSYRFGMWGVRAGKWQKPHALDPRNGTITETIRHAVAEPPQPIKLPRVRVNVCIDCGKQLDHFGACPSATPLDMTLQTAPVFCGKPAQSELSRVSAAAYRITDKHLGTEVRG